MKKKEKQKEIRAAGLELLCDPQFLFRVSLKLKEMGVIGEEKTCLTLFLAALTKDVGKSVSVLVKGPTSSGKNNALRSVVALLPPESVITRASLTPTALAYGSGDLTGRVIYLYEYRGGRDAQYMTRELQSEGSLSHEHTVPLGKDRSTRVARRAGDPVFLSTTTSERVHADDETRYLSLRADESEGLTREVLRSKFQQAVPTNPQPAVEIFQEAVRLLAEDSREFRHPGWFSFLADQIPASETRARRDAGRFLSLQKAVTACTSFSDRRRERKGDIEIGLGDYAIAYEILSEAFAFTYGGTHPQALKVAETVSKLYRDLKRPITVREVKEHLAWEQALTYKWVNVAIESKLIDSEPGTQEKNLKRLIPGANVETTFLPHPLRVLQEGQNIVKLVRYISPLTGRPQILRRPSNEDDDL